MSEKAKILEKLENKEIDEVCYWRKEYDLTDWWVNRLSADNCENCDVCQEDIRDFIDFLKDEGYELVDEWRDEKEHNKFIKEQIELFTKILEETDWDNYKIIFHEWY